MLVIIQIIIAVIVVYLVFSIIVYVIVEWIAGLLHLRGNTLKDAIVKLFNGTPYQDFGEKIFQHPQIENLKNYKGKLPSYIPANNVAVALIDLVKEKASVTKATIKHGEAAIDEPRMVYELYKDGLRQLDNSSSKLAGGQSSTKKTFLTSVTEQTNDLKSLTSAIEKWYNDYMDRVTGWYKMNIKIIVLVIGALVTIGFNVDTLHIINTAATDPKTRERLNMFADQIIKDSLVNSIVMQQRNDQDYFEDYVNDDSFGGKDSADQNRIRDSLVDANVNKNMEEFKRMNQMIYKWELPVGWDVKKEHSFFWTIVGWLITALALSAGAPFWFDLLKRLVNIRNAGIKPEPTKKSD